MDAWSGILVVVIAILISSTQGAPTLSVDDTPSNYSSSVTLKCSDPDYVSGNGYSWTKNGVTIFNNAGEATTTGKYSGDIDGTTLKLIINDLVADDEDSYVCNHAFLDSNALNIKVESRGTVTAKLSSSNELRVTLEQIYPNSTTVDITCGTNTVGVVFESSVADGDRFTNTWKSTNTFSTLPTSCSASVTLWTTFDTAFTVTSASTEDKTSDTDAIVGGTVGGVLGLCCLAAAAVVGIRHLKKKGRTTTLTFVEGSKVTFSCPFPESVTFPEWRGPPGLTIYTILDDTSETINSKIPAFNRLQYARNKRDLILSNAVVGDSGDYKCSYTGQGDHTFTLKVIRGKGDQASNVVNAGSHRPGRPQPPPPSGANSNHREGSGSVVSGRDVEMQETETSFKRRQLPDIHDKKGRGLSANYNDDDHPLVSINIPTKKPGALESIPDSDRQEVTKKKKKRKKRVETEDNQSD